MGPSRNILLLDLIMAVGIGSQLLMKQILSLQKCLSKPIENCKAVFWYDRSVYGWTCWHFTKLPSTYTFGASHNTYFERLCGKYTMVLAEDCWSSSTALFQLFSFAASIFRLKAPINPADPFKMIIEDWQLGWHWKHGTIKCEAAFFCFLSLWMIHFVCHL